MNEHQFYNLYNNYRFLLLYDEKFWKYDMRPKFQKQSEYKKYKILFNTNNNFLASYKKLLGWKYSTGLVSKVTGYVMKKYLNDNE